MITLWIDPDGSRWDLVNHQGQPIETMCERCLSLDRDRCFDGGVRIVVIDTEVVDIELVDV